MKPTLKQVAVLKFSSTLRYNYNKLDLEFQKTELLINLQVKIQVPRQGVFSHLLSLNSVVYFKNTKLDVDLGYVSNDRSE
jgi:iron complex outermembrane receptor protein